MHTLTTTPKAMTRAACIDLAREDYEEAIAHAKQVLTHDARNPLAPVVLALGYRALGETEKADAVIEEGRQDDCFHMLLRWLSGMSEAHFFSKMDSEPAQTTLDMAFDLLSMGQASQTEKLLTSFGAHCGHTIMTALTLAYALHLQGKPEDGALAAAEEAPVGDTFPVRLGELAVLQHALCSGVKRAAFLLGCEYYDKRQYELAGELFEQSTRDEPDNYMTYRSLAIACFSHLNRKAEAMPLMQKALSMTDSEEVLYETVILMDQQNAAPEDKIALLAPRAASMHRDDLFVELAKAYNQARQPEKARETLLGHLFTACEGGVSYLKVMT